MSIFNHRESIQKPRPNTINFLFLLLLIAFSVQGCGQERELTKEQMAVRQGKELYKKSCASCHGASANGLGSRSGPSLKGPNYRYGGTTEALHHSIKHGQENGMPAFDSIYSDTEIDNIVSYLLFLIK